jgi:hypothetical protein
MNEISSRTNESAAAPTNSPFHQPTVPAPDGGDKQPVVHRTEPVARPSAMERAQMTPQERWRADQPAPAPVITQAEREAAHKEGRAPVPNDPAVSAANDAANTEKVKLGEFEVTNAELAQLVADKAAKDSFKLTHASPEAYKVELPADFKVPEGVTIEFNKNDPAMAQAREFCFENGLSQEAFSKLIGTYAGLKAAEVLQFTNYKKAEIAKLGAAGTERVTAVVQWMAGMMGPDAKDLARALDYAPSEKTVVAFEKLMRKFSSQGNTNFTQSGRDHSEPGMTDEQWNGMSFNERREYTRSANSPRRR